MCIKVGSVGQSFTTDLQYLRDTTSSQEQSTLPAVTYSQDDAEDAACISSSGSSRHLVPRYVFPLLHQLCLCLAFTISTELHLLGSQLKWWFPSLFVLYSLFVLLFPLKVFFAFFSLYPLHFPLRVISDCECPSQWREQENSDQFPRGRASYALSQSTKFSPQ